ncbi:tenascin-X isoform X14 [Rhineura floridana]|uniref:tenascin-X isoform X14 n=1 Tax=Rhineura floridana TaxID=261503 RepID=UPI002AC81794|nr:tenascin-X isoform X14 [Rhineura floridana]
MRRPPRTLSFLLFLFWLGTSWEAHLPHPFIRSNATVFSHVYTIKLAGEGPEAEGASPAPQEALGPPGSSRGGGLYEHTLEGPDQEHVVFTHRINLPTQACGCPPGTEDTQDLLRRLQALENEVRALRDTCQAGGGCCPATASSQASTGQTDIRTLCSHHGSFDVSRCVCECEPGWSGPTCAEPACPGGCGGPQRGKCVNRRCQCRPGYSGTHCEEPPTCPDDCNDQGRCVDGRCTCFPGYVGPSCADPACPEGCQGHGQCVSGRCVCNPGYSGPDCGSRACPSNCNRRGECRNGRCVCETGFTGPACGTKTCPNDCSQRGRCLKGAVCACFKGYTGPDCSQLACPEDCNGHGECQNGVCLCHDGFSGDDCSIEIPTIGVRVSNRDETSFRLEWNRPGIPVDGYEINVIPTHDQVVGESVRLPSTETVFERRGLKPGEEYLVTIRAEKGQSYGPPVTQPVRTRVAPPLDLHSSQVTENTVTLDWEPPASRPDGYILSYVPLVATQPTQAPKRVELPAEPESVTLEDLESNTPYRITLIARQNGENSRGSSIIVSTTAPAPSQPIRRYSTPSPSSHLEPDNSFTRPGSRKPGIKPHPGSALSNTTKARELFMKKMTENISAKLSPFNGTLLERLESYLWATNFPLHGNRTIQTVARDIYLYLILRKPEEVIEKVKDLLDKEMDDSLPKREFPIGEADSAYSDGYSRPDHAKPAVVASSSDGIEVSLDGVRGVSDNVVIRYRNTGSGEGGEFMVPGDASTALITGLDPGTTYHVEIHGVVKGHSSKSYSFITSTAPGSPSAAEIQTVPSPTLTPEVPLRDLTVTDVSPNSLRMVWSAPPSSFSSFSLQYRDPKSSAPPREIRVPGTERSVAVMGLSPNTDYELELSGEKPNGIYSPPVTTKASTAPAPEAEKPTLGKISVSEVTDNSARLSWDVPTGSFDSFLIQYKDAEGKPKGLPVDGGSREVTVSNLAPSRKYKFNLYGLVGRKRVGPVSTETVTAPRTAPPSLGELSTSDITSDSVRLFWSIPSGSFDSFLVQYKDAEGRPQVLPMEGDSREVTIPSLVPSHRYRFNLYGISNRKRLGPATTDVTTASREEEPVPEPMPEPVLGDLSVSDATSNTVRLTWNVPTDRFDSFLLQYQDPEGNDQTLRINRDSREIAVPNLVPSQRYRFNLYGISGTQLLGPVSADVVTAESQETITERPDETILTPPSLGELWASDVTSDSICLSWTVPTGSFDSFLVQYKDSEGKPQALPVDGSSREVTVPNLVPSRRYKFNLYGVLGRKRSSPISTDATTAPPIKKPTLPLRLGELTASNAMPNSLDLSWTVEDGDFDSFIIQYRDAQGKPQVLPIDGGLRSLHLHDLAPSHRYQINIYGVSGRKRLGPISTEAETAPLPTTPPPQPSLGEVSVSDVTSDSVRLSWTVPTGNFDSFLIQYKDAEGRAQAVPLEGASREVSIPNLAPSRRYKFNLYGVSGHKRLGPLSADTVTAPLPTTPPPQPSLGEVSVSDVTSDSVRLSWTVPTGSFDSFLIQYKDAEGKPQVVPVEGASREVSIPNLTPSRRYKFNLYGVSGRKRLGPLSADTVTASPPQEPPIPPSLGELSASDVTSNSIHLSWTVPMGTFDSFLVQYKDSEGKPQAIPVGGALRETIVPNLVPSRRYKFNLYGLTGRKRLGPISTDAVTAAAEIRAAPTLGELSVSNVTSESVRLSWTVPTGNFDSFLIQYKDAEGKAQALPLEGGTLETTITGLSPARRYKFNLYGLVGRKRLGPVSADTVTAVQEEDKMKPSVGELSVSDVTSNSALLSWTVPSGSFDSFLIQYKDSEGKPQALPVEGASREVTVPNLAPSHRYKFNLYGISGRKRLGPISSEATTAEKEEGGEEDGQNEPSLGQLSVSEANSNSVRLSWSVPTGNFDSFLVRYEGEEDELQSMPVDSGSHEVIVPNLSPSQRYRFDLYGISGGKLLGPVSTDTFTAPLTEQEVEEKETGTPPPQPDLGELSASDVTSNSVRLSWDIPTGTFDSFLIQYNDADNKLQALPIDKETNSVLIDYLVPSNRYKFNLYGVSGRRHVGPSSVIVVTDDETESPGAGGEVDQEVPTGTEPRLGELSVPEVTSNTARLSWSVPVGSFDSFSVQYKDAEGRPQALPVGGDSREVIVPNLVPAHKYKFNLYGTSGNQRLGPISANAVTTATGHEKPGAGGEVDQEVPTGTEPRLGELSVPEVTSNTARLSWSVPVGSFDSFSVQYKDAEGRPQALPVGGDSREVIVPNLVPAHKYKFNLYGTSGNQRLGPISANAVTTATDHEKPGAGGEVDQEVPTGTEPRLGELSVPEVTSNTARLSWSVPVGSFDSFSVQYKDAEGRPQALPVGGDSREVIVPNLVPAHKYKFNLYGTSGNQRLGPISANAVTTATDHEKPGAGGEVDQEVPTGTEPRLGELSVPEVTSNTARLSWSVPVGSFDSFSVQYKDAEGRPQALPVGGDSREVIVPNLVPAHKYKFNLYGTSGNQRLGPISANAVTTATDHEKPGAGGEVDQEVPTGTEPRLGELSVPEVTSNTARLSWSVPVGSFDSFSVQYKDAEGRPQALPVGGDSREVIVPNLVPAHKYKFNLYGTSGNQRLGPISANAVTTAATETTQPSVKEAEPSLGDATVSEVTPDSLLLSWTIQEGSFDSFLIQYKDAAGKLQNLPVDGTMRSLHLYNLTPLQRYKFNIFGVSGHKRLGPVSVDAVTASEPAPIKTGVPQHILDDLSVSNTTSNSVSLSWSVPAGNFDSFLIQYKDREGKPQVLPLSGDSRDVTIPNLAPSHRYKFNLFGIYGHKRLGPVSTDAVTGPAPSTEPGKTTAQLKLGELSAHDITSESLLLSWTVETGNFDSFIIQYRDADGKPHALPVDGGLHSLRLHDLVPSHRYRFNLFGVSGSKRLGPISTEAITATPVQPVPPKPTLGELSASDINSTSAHLSWSVASGNFDSFIIQYRDAEGKPQALPVDGSSRDIIVSNLVPSRRYKFNLYGISGRKRLGPISTEAVTARMKEPEIRPKLGDLSISEVTQDSVRLSWTISAGKFDSFLIQYKDAEEKLQTIPVDADSRTVVISDLMTSHRYNFNLYGISGKKQIGPISTDAVTAFSEVPSEQPVLENLVVSEVTPTTLQLTWDAPEGGFDSFQIRYKDSLLGSGRSPPPAKEMNVPGHDRSALLRGLTPNTEYSVAVSGVRNGSEVANINTVARTSGLELESPRDLRFSDIRETSVVANWRPPSSRIDHYKVSFQPSDGGEPRSIIVDGSKLKTTIEDLTPGASYEVTVMSLRGFEESEPLVGYVTTVPDGPADLRAVSVTDSSAVLTWHPAVAEMNNYIVTYGPAGGTRVSESVPGNRNQLPLSGLRLDTEYRASVYGERDGNRSSPISATFTTGADGPRDLQATDISPRSAHLVWSPPRAPPEGYLLSYKTPYGQSKEIPLDASVTSHKLQNLIPSSRYQVQVQALRRGTPTAPTSTSFTTGHLIYPFPRDCAEESLNGPGPSRTTTIYLGGKQDRPLQVYCDMETDGGGWIVFQRRMNGETDFWRDWQDYATGFGNLTREFWLGNDALHQLTSSRDFELRVDLRARNESVYATYQNFRVDPPADYYRLHVGGYSGTAGDALTYHSGSVFSARDRDPNRLIIPCAVSYRGAWWYRNCHYTNLNGLYGNSRDHQGVSWFNWKGFEFSIPFTEMKLRPRGFQLRRA